MGVKEWLTQTWLAAVPACFTFLVVSFSFSFSFSSPLYPFPFLLSTFFLCLSTRVVKEVLDILDGPGYLDEWNERQTEKEDRHVRTWLCMYAVMTL